MQRILSTIVFCLCFVAGFAGVAFASGGASVDETLIADALNAVVSAFQGGHAKEAAFLTVVLAVAVVKKLVAPRVTWLRSPEASALMVLAASFAGVTGAGGGAKDALFLAFAAAGGYHLIKLLGGALLGSKLGQLLPQYVRAALYAALWVFDRPGQAAVEQAEVAGDAAVKASPPTGAGPTTTIK
jgi:hypothetical protein